MTIDPKQFRPSFLQNDPDIVYQNSPPRYCIMKCGKLLPRWVKFYCSGDCMKLARERGTYGHEEDMQNQAA